MATIALMSLNGQTSVLRPLRLSTLPSPHTVRPSLTFPEPALTCAVIAKHEPPPPNPQHHGHLTALSISPPARSYGLARTFMNLLEQLSSEGKDGVNAWFVDLFVRCNNGRAVEMYERMGYSVYRRVVE